MNNIYITTLNGYGKDCEQFRRMYELSSASARKHLVGVNEHVLIMGEPGPMDLPKLFQRTFRATYDLWCTGANVLYLNVDTLVVKPTEVFGKFSEFRMFTPTVPMKWMEFNPYLNAGVRYFPAEMDAGLWNIGVNRMRDYDVSYWGHEQMAYNAMYREQGTRAGFVYELNYGMPPDVRALMEIDKSDATILHFHATRGAEACVRQMEAYAA